MPESVAALTAGSNPLWRNIPGKIDGLFTAKQTLQLWIATICSTLDSLGPATNLCAGRGPLFKNHRRKFLAALRILGFGLGAKGTTFSASSVVTSFTHTLLLQKLPIPHSRRPLNAGKMTTDSNRARY
jgi:hypothetical protein